MNNAFCVPFEKLEGDAIAQLLRVHPDALPISVEWKCDGHRSGAAVIWWARRSDTVMSIEEKEK